MYSQLDINSILESLIREISKSFSISEAYLFGSYATGTANEFSDIDVALVSNDFEGSRFLDKKKLYKYLLNISADVELHPFKSTDFNDSDPFVIEIKRTGIKII